MEKESSNAWKAIAAALLIVALLLGGYVAGYLWLGEQEVRISESAAGTEVKDVRRYRIGPMAKAFVPLARVESALTGRRVVIIHR